MSQTAHWFLTALVVIIAIFSKRMIRLLGLQPERARDVLWFVAAFVCFAIAPALITDSFVTRNWPLFTGGAILGFLYGLLSGRHAIRHIKGDVLSFRTGLSFYVTVSLVLIVGLWAAHARRMDQFNAFAAGLCLTSMVAMAGMISRHERHHGILYVCSSPGRNTA